ncbi:hypothetical protein BDP27DRAFT_1451541 [Rhodocollybia butyracea]|uniref:Uncharacterized protein n=1 Tax=Rhodocollybia butyracea TaxID=206335 RepID=A0A9P5U1H4_9AGAR|nr:hypothetical protein BDP27DRAFT_1451541 [Rhodocollybia butyracea]
MSDLPFLLAGSCINILFYGTEVGLGSFYFLNSPPNPLFRWSLGISLLIDTVCTVVVCYNVYFYFLSGSTDLLSSRLNEPWTLPITILCTYSAAMVEEVFFIHRFWKITHNKLVTLVACFLMISHLSVHWILVIDLFTTQAVTMFNTNLTIIGNALCAATDVFIAVVMLHTTSTIKTTFIGTQSLLRRISIQSMACGITTSVSTILVLSLFLTDNTKPCTVLFDILGRLYTLTILFNYFMLRKSMANANAVTVEPTTVNRPQTVAFRQTYAPRTFTIPPVELTSIHESGLHELTSIYETSSGSVPHASTKSSQNIFPVDGSGSTAPF